LSPALDSLKTKDEVMKNLPSFLKLIATGFVLLLAVGVCGLWLNTILIGGMFSTAPFNAAGSTLACLLAVYGAYRGVRFIWS
jgi:hypothetical protein